MRNLFQTLWKIIPQHQTRMGGNPVVSSIATQRLGRNDQNTKAGGQKSMSTKAQPKFGICFDIDGVLVHGTQPLPPALEGLKLLQDAQKKFIVPVTFVTNHVWSPEEKAEHLSEWFDTNITTDQVITAQVPLKIYSEFMHKNCLIIGQGPLKEVAKELGMEKVFTLQEILEAYPLLDVVDHERKMQLGRADNCDNIHFPEIEAIFLMGEPTRWEAPLQVIVDLLMTNGKPTINVPSVRTSQHIPVIACNLDLQFMHRVHLPRYGHGAFLHCLESLYQKVSGHPLQYSVLAGKPSEVTFRYAEHCLVEEALKLGYNRPLQTMYMIGDNAEVDIVGANLYQLYANNRNSLPLSRMIPEKLNLHPQTVQEVVGILVHTGVSGQNKQQSDSGDSHHRHREFPTESDLSKATVETEDVLGAIKYILEKEGIQVPNQEDIKVERQ